MELQRLGDAEAEQGVVEAIKLVVGRIIASEHGLATADMLLEALENFVVQLNGRYHDALEAHLEPIEADIKSVETTLEKRIQVLRERFDALETWVATLEQIIDRRTDDAKELIGAQERRINDLESRIDGMVLEAQGWMSRVDELQHSVDYHAHGVIR